MATVTEHVEQSTQDAWTEYAERLRGLEGSEYERVEEDAWAELQTTLDTLADIASAPDEPIE